MSEEPTTPEVPVEIVDEAAVVEAPEAPATQTAEDASQEALEADQEALGGTADSPDESDDDDSEDQDCEDDDEDEDPLDTEGDIAADYLEELLDIADLDGDIDTFSEGGRAHVAIVTDSQTLVGKGGEVLDALQELARLAVMTETGHRSRLMLDIAGHRERRRKELQVLAHDAIAEVKTSGEAVRLTPMNPFERKIVHDAVADAGLVSESEGTEPQRRVVVLPAD